MAGRRPLAAKEVIVCVALPLLLLGRGRERERRAAAEEEELLLLLPPPPPVVLLLPARSLSAAVLLLSLYSLWIAIPSAVKLRPALARKTEEALGLASEVARARRAGSRLRVEEDDDAVDGETETVALEGAAAEGTVALLVAEDTAASAGAAFAVETGERSRRESAARAEERHAARRCRRGALGLVNRRAMLFSRR